MTSFWCVELETEKKYFQPINDLHFVERQDLRARFLHSLIHSFLCLLFL